MTGCVSSNWVSWAHGKKDGRTAGCTTWGQADIEGVADPGVGGWLLALGHSGTEDAGEPGKSRLWVIFYDHDQTRESIPGIPGSPRPLSLPGLVKFSFPGARIGAFDGTVNTCPFACNICTHDTLKSMGSDVQSAMVWDSTTRVLLPQAGARLLCRHRGPAEGAAPAGQHQCHGGVPTRPF